MQLEPETNIKNATQNADGTAFIGHPKGLGFIVFTEAWERFSFYGMQALLVLYMATHLFLPEHSGNVTGFGAFQSFLESIFGPMSTQALASQTFGIYVGLVYFSPVIGGYLGDRFIGQHAAVMIGAMLMAIGHFLMAFEVSFLVALLFLIAGSGFLKGNLAAQVGQLYEASDQRRDAGYTIYNFSINVGAAIAPLVCGTLGELYGWHYGFGIAGIGMLVGLAIYVAGSRHLPKSKITSETIAARKLKKEDFAPIFVILIMLAITSLYWTAQAQVWNVYPLWIKDEVNRLIFGFEVPVTWFQSLDFMFVLAAAPLVLWLWRRQNKQGNEPQDSIKIAIGCLIFGLAFMMLVIGEMTSSDAGINMFWPFIFHCICGTGFLYIGPVAMSFISRVAPVSVNSMMIGSYYLAIFIGGFGSGWLGQLYETMAPQWFWLIHGGIVSSGAVLIVLLKPFMDKMARAE